MMRRNTYQNARFLSNFTGTMQLDMCKRIIVFQSPSTTTLPKSVHGPQPEDTSSEACRLIDSYGKADSKLIQYVESHVAQCGLQISIGAQLKNNHRNTAAMVNRVCWVAQQMEKQLPAGPVGDFENWR